MIGFISLTAIVFIANSAAQANKDYPLRLQPELDSVDVDAYLKNERLFNLQIKCVMDEGPCDIVGRFLKPRVAKALLGECQFCTPIQQVKLTKALEDLQNNKPELYRRIFLKFIENAGVKVDSSQNVDVLQNEENSEHELKAEADGAPTEVFFMTTTSPDYD